MVFSEDKIELGVFLLVVVILAALGGTIFTQYLDKARLTLSVAAVATAQNELKTFRTRTGAYPAFLDLTSCDTGEVVLDCTKLMADVDSVVSYSATDDTFILKVKAKNSDHTVVTVTEAAISY